MPKPLFLYLKGAVYLMGAIATLGADVDILQELSYTVDYLTKTHGEQFKTDIGLDVEATPVNSDKLLSLVKATAGVDADATSLSFRDLQRGQAGQVKDAAQAGKTD